MTKKLQRLLAYRVRRISTPIAVAILTFLCGVGLTAVFLVRRHEQTIEKPILQMNVCDVVRNPAQYQFKFVRLKGAMIGFHELVLYDDACKGEENYIRVVLDQSSRAHLGQLTAKLENHGLRAGNFYLQVVLTGRLELEPRPGDLRDPIYKDFPDPHPIQYRARLIVFSLEEVEPLNRP
jgi:hypothetical protein